MSEPTIHHSRQRLRRYGQQIGRWLIAAPETVVDMQQRRQVQLVSIWWLIILGALLLHVAVGGSLHWSIFLLLLAAYALSRTAYYRVAAMILVGLLVLPSYLSLLAESEFNFFTLGARVAWLAIPVVLVSLFFSVRGTAVFAGINLILLLLLPAVISDLHLQDMVGVLGFFGILSGVVFIVAYQRNILERDRREELAQAYEIVRQSHIELQAIIEATPVALAISHIQGGPLLFTNTRFNETFGYTRETIQQIEARNLYFDAGEYQKVSARCTQEGALQNYEIQTRRADGSTFWHSISVVPFQFQGESVWFTSFQDISERKAAELALRRTTERLMILHQIEQGIINARSPAAIAAATLERIRQFIQCQRVSLALFDFTAQTATLFAVTTDAQEAVDVGRVLPLAGFIRDEAMKQGELFVMEDLTAVTDITPIEKRRMEEEGIRSYINVPLMARGEMIGSLNLAASEPNPWAEESLDIAKELATQLSVAIDQARLLETAEQSALGLETLHNIGLELSAQLDLKVLLETLVSQAARLVEAESGSIFLTNPEENVLEIAAITTTGTLPVLNRIKRGEGVTGYAWEVDRTVSVGNYAEWPRRLPGFEHMQVAVLSIPIRWGSEVTGVLNFIGQRAYAFTAAHMQLMELLAAQAAIAIHNAQLHEQIQTYVAELEKQNAELERFTYTVSHDLKSPLVTVNGFLGFLEQDIATGNEQRIKQDMGRIRDATARMQMLLDDLLELSRIGRLINLPRIVSFNELVEEALLLVFGQLNQSGVQVDVWPNLPMVEVDHPRVIEVLQNLLDNGVKYMGSQPEPHIEVGGEQRQNEWVFFVRDNGMGIQKQYHEKVFGLFERIDQTSEGTGIGLALAKRIIEVHNGRIWIESEGLGQGTAVCFTLPIVFPQEA